MGTHTTEATSISQACEIIVNVIKMHPSELPFISVYMEDKGKLHISGTVSILSGTDATPEIIVEGHHYVSSNQERFAEAISRAASTGNKMMFSRFI